MYRVGLTGGIAAGKSEVSRVLREHGAVVIEADIVARKLVEPGNPVLNVLVGEFGDGILAPDGTLDRAELGRIAFASEEQLARLNAITHPPLVAELISIMEATERDTRRGVLVVDAALLVEWDIVDLFDVIVVVDAPLELRVRRLAEFGLSETEASERMAAQRPPTQLRTLADIVIANDGSLDDLRRRAGELAQRLHEASERGDG
ncbi:dephospho-CoA kinase [bacterium]|nr:dephospho-CoA kinase [bacterium]